MKSSKIPQLVRHWRKKLGLLEWDIVAQLVPADKLAETDFSVDTASASIDVPHMYAVLRIATGRSEEEVVADIIHELVHVRLAPILLVLQALCEHVGTDAAAVAKSLADAAAEQATMAIGRALSGGK